MEQPTTGGSQAQARPRAKMNYACEACRSSKVKCLTSPLPGICKRCADFKRECVFRTGPRTRRPKNPPPDAIIRPPPGPSKTFSIDFSMPADEDPATHFDSLREHHERILEDLLPSPDREEDEGKGGGQIFSLDDQSRTPSSMTMASSSTRSPRRQRPLGELGIQPQFNLDSAERLLATFQDTLLPHCPSVALPDGADVRSLARDMPFVLLAILAVTSCSTSLQGHSLYDEEFRKVLGLKFVTSSERSLEMLQGLLIYCAWYPFHLRPKNRQVIQYMRMAVDIVQDLELDREGGYMSLDPQDKLPGIRAFLACHYSLSNYYWTWRMVPALPYNSWVAHCWEVLERSSTLDGDQTLVWLVRLQHITDAAEELDQTCMNSKNGSPIDHHRNIMRLGLEVQLREWQRAIPGRFATAHLPRDGAPHEDAPTQQEQKERQQAPTSLIPLVTIFAIVNNRRRQAHRGHGATACLLRRRVRLIADADAGALQRGPQPADHRAHRGAAVQLPRASVPGVRLGAGAAIP
ncbi:hypothetical protein DL766_009696 [Monosporascus sp. MC13-8B]|nr:hypothetical protein DL763_007607 [Monosporascus cannonballus]RYP14414.1 hypothetical protein DL766_009696 [Monosporascus sp. MC13-8B]